MSLNKPSPQTISFLFYQILATKHEIFINIFSEPFYQVSYNDKKIAQGANNKKKRETLEKSQRKWSNLK